MRHALRRPNFKPHAKGPGGALIWREHSFKVDNGRAIVCPLGDKHRESGRNQRISAEIRAPESLSRAAEHKMHGIYLPAKGLRMRRSERRQGCSGAEIPECRSAHRYFGFEKALRGL